VPPAEQVGVGDGVPVVVAVAVAVGVGLDVSVESIRTALDLFRGVDRRFQLRGRVAGVSVIDDYGHHPTEIKATLAAAKQCGYGKIHVIFQPHRYTRTSYCFEEFARSFYQADLLILSSIYSAGEEPIEGISSEKLVESIKSYGHKNVRLIADPGEIASSIQSEIAAGDLVITMWAGNIWKVGEQLLQRFQLADQRANAV
jgi:UDP-N-acetylmuramate--alanine ligase